MGGKHSFGSLGVCVPSKAVDTGNRHAGAGKAITKRWYSSLQVLNDWKQNGFSLSAGISNSFLLF